APPSPDYVPSLEHPPSPDYVPGPEYPEYVAPSDDVIIVKDQPLSADASPTILSRGYVIDSNLEEDHEEDLVDCSINRGDDEEEESSEDDNDDGEEEEEIFEEDKDEKEHPAPVHSAALHVIDPVPSAEESKQFETDESAATPPPPRSPQTGVPFS
nr:hypothetical protein [Tanacetum cinerariifolium]